MKNYGQNDKIKEYQKEYYKEYYKEHKEEYIKRKQEWRKNNPEASREERKNYIENMSWDNYGKEWHIDHIIPCNAWNFSNEFENKCWNYRNL